MRIRTTLFRNFASYPIQSPLHEAYSSLTRPSRHIEAVAKAVQAEKSIGMNANHVCPFREFKMTSLVLLADCTATWRFRGVAHNYLKPKPKDHQLPSFSRCRDTHLVGRGAANLPICMFGLSTDLGANTTAMHMPSYVLLTKQAITCTRSR